MICKQCNKEFIISSEDKEFYQRIGVPEPTLCPDCRRQRRLVHRNERYLYEGKCHLCQKPIITQYNQDLDTIIYCSECWWSDKWDPLAYGQEFDFNRSFFEQWNELIRKVPKLTLLNFKSENSDYTHLVSNNKSCYLIFSSDYNEQCYYSNWLEHCNNCIDGFYLTKCDQVYFSFFCERLFKCQFCIKCFSSNEINFCYDCRNSQNCTFCWNLRNQQYHFLNKKYSKEEYEKKLRELKLDTIEGQQNALKIFQELIEKEAIHQYSNQLGRVEKSLGDYLTDTKNSRNCFMLNQAENCSYVSNMIEMKDCYDCEFGGEGEFGIENIETFPMPYRAIGTINCYVGNDVYYSFNCMGSKDILGCACLKKFQYCLLNKQYSEENYLKIKEKVISHMRKTGEWGEFLPIKYSLFGYNETNAIDYFPLSKEEIRSQNWPWYEFIRKKEASTAVYQNIKQCFKCLKSFKLIPQEIEFYKIQKLPEPKNCYQCRYAERLLWRNQNKLYHRECVKCRKEIFSTYSPKRTEKIFCIECYNKKIY